MPVNAAPKSLCDPLEALLIGGGDARLILDPHSGLNPFGCTPLPAPAVLSYGSCTASSISPQAFCRVEQERDALLNRLRFAAPADALDAATEQARRDLKSLLGLNGTGTEIVFSPSGTDSVLHARFLAQTLSDGKPMDIIVAAADETGSGVPNALAGRHFSATTARGIPVTKGEPIAGFSQSGATICIPMRGRDGSLRTPAAIDQEVFEAATRSVNAGRRVLMQGMDGSKLGARCPGADCLRALQSRFADAVCIVVDACQMRLSPARLRWHLAQGHLVLISGSKFFTGPPFSGAILVPASLAAQMETIRHVPEGLRDYTVQSDWPVAWTGIRSSLSAGANFGPYFRWLAALEEMRHYISVPLAFRRAVLRQFAEIVREQMCRRRPDIQPLPTWKNPADAVDDAEMDAQTIFPFLVRRERELLSFDDATRLYRLLNRNIADALPARLSERDRSLAARLCHVGQPVSIPLNETDKTGAIRLCASARLVAAVWERNGENLSVRGLQQIDLEPENHAIATVLDKVGLISRHLAALSQHDV